MEMQYTYAQPNAMIVRNPNFPDHSRAKVNWPQIGHRMVNYSPSLPEPNRWMKSSTGGLAGINSPFSETYIKYSVNPQEMASRNRVHIHETPTKTKSNNFQQIVRGRPTFVPGQPKDVVQGYYKEFVAAGYSNRPKNSTAYSHRRMTNGHCHIGQEESVQKRIRTLRGEDENSSAFSIVNRKENISHSSIQERLKALPPPPPLVKVDKRSQQEMRRTPNPKDARLVSKSQERIPEVPQTKKRQQNSEGILRNSETLHAYRECSSPKEAKIIRIDRKSEQDKHRKVQVVPECEGVRQKSLVPMMSQTSNILIPTSSGTHVNGGRFSVPPDTHFSVRHQDMHRYSHNARNVQGSAVQLENRSPSRQQNIHTTPRSIGPSVKQHTTQWGIQSTPVSEECRVTPRPKEPYDNTTSPIQKTTSRSQESRYVVEPPTVQKQISNGPKKNHTSHNDVIIIRDSPPPSQWYERTSQCFPRTAWRSYSFESNKTLYQHGLNYAHIQEEMTKEKTSDKHRTSKNSHCRCAICCELSKKSQTEQLPSPKSWRSSSSQSAPSILIAQCPTPYNTVNTSVAVSHSCTKKLQRSYSTHDVCSVSQCNDYPCGQCSPSVVKHTQNLSQDTGIQNIQPRQHSSGCVPVETPAMQNTSGVKSGLYTGQTQVLRPSSDSHLRDLLIRPKVLSPDREKEPQHDKNKNEIFPVKMTERRATTTSQERQILVDTSQDKGYLKRAFSESDATADKGLNNDTLLKLPIDEGKEESSNSYGGFAYDHDSLPIIIAVHSIAADNQPTNDDKVEVDKTDQPANKNTSSGVTQVEAPKHCVVLPQAKKTEQVPANQPTKRTSVPTPDTKTKDTANQEKLQPKGSLPSTELKSPKKAVETSKPVSNQKHPHNNNLPMKPKLINDFVKGHYNIKARVKKNIQFVKPQKKEVTVESLTKKIIETRQRMEDENIEWKRKLLGRLKYVLIKRLRKMEGLTGVKSALEFPEEKEKPKTASKTLTSEKSSHEDKTDAVKDVVKKDLENTKQILKKKKHKVKKIVVTTKLEDPSSDYELTIEETQESQETNSEEIEIC